MSDLVTVAPDITHVMPNPIVVPILWGHDYIEYPQTAQLVEQLISDLVTGPFMNGMAQYGVRRGRLAPTVIIDDKNPPATIVWTDQDDQFVDEITHKLIAWIDAGLVPPPPSSSSSSSDDNWMYLIIPPSETTPEMYNGAQDPIGNGVQGWHNVGVTNPAGPPIYYWAIVKTNDCGPPSASRTFVNNFAAKVCHELAEQFVDRNGSFKEVGDACVNSGVTYRGWNIQKYWSDWDNGCISGDQPPMMPRSFQTVDGYAHIFVLGADGNLWLERPPFGNAPPLRQQVDANVFTFQALDDGDVIVLGTDGNLWLEHAPFGSLPPRRQQIDGDVKGFQALNAGVVFVLGSDGNLWMETAPFGSAVPPARTQVDGSVKEFLATGQSAAFVLGNDGNLWLAEGPFGTVPPRRQHVDGQVRGFAALPNPASVLVVRDDATLWFETGPFGALSPRDQIADGVLVAQFVDPNHALVLGTDATLRLATAPFGSVPAARWPEADGSVMEFWATDVDNILVLGADGKLWWERAPFGATVPPRRILIDGNVA